MSYVPTPDPFEFPGYVAFAGRRERRKKAHVNTQKLKVAASDLKPRHRVRKQR